MRCGRCGKDNREGRRFCTECGAALPANCAHCGATIEPGEKFCGECGSAPPVTPLPPAAEPQPAQTVRFAVEESAAQPRDGERKTVTALFADIKGSMELMEDLDPEEARAIVDPALRLMIDAVHRYDGYIVQSTGDGIFALFGAPVAHEDHPLRALYAALRMQEEMRRYAERLRADKGINLQVRVGVNTGEVVVRSIQTEGGHAEYTPIGHSTGLAARLQTLANPGAVVIGEGVRQLAEGYFQLKPLGPARIKGANDAIEIFEVTGLGPLRTRLQVSAQRGLTKFVGRQAEMEQMRHALELAKSAHGQIVAAIGEPGVGKSRLFFEFKVSALSGCLVLETASVSHGKASAYLPVIDLLKNYFKIIPEDDDRARREKVIGKVLALDRSLEDALPFLFGLAGIGGEDEPLAQEDAQIKRRRTQEAVKRIILRESLNQPLIVIVEDLHWVDAETQAVVNLLVDSIANARVLLLVNYRPEYRHEWGSRTCYTQLRLDPLGKESAQEMLRALLGSNLALPDQEDGRGEGVDALKRLIIERTEGNPFFMEEIVQGLFEQGGLARNGAVHLTRPVAEIRIPPTVQAILAARIDRLPPAEKELLQTLAVIGRQFPLGLVRAINGKPEDELERMLGTLRLGEFIYEQPAMGDIEYAFKHALTQEVAYNSVLSERRKLLHERAAQAIEALHAESVEDHLPELARHYDLGGNVAKAVEFLGRAAQRAAQQVAHAEAVGYLNRALELFKHLPESADRDSRELNLQTALSWSLFALSPAAPERERALLRVQQLSEQLGDAARLMEGLLHLGLTRMLRQEYSAAQEFAHRVLALAESAAARSTLAGAHLVLGLAFFYRGELQASREHLELAGARLNVGSLPDFAEAQYAESAAASLSTTLLMLGYPAAATRMSRDLVAAMRQSSNPISVQRSLNREAVNHRLLHNGRSALKHADEAVSIATDVGMTMSATLAAFSRGRALADEGQRQEGIVEMSRAIASLQGTPVISMYYADLAESLGQDGSPEEGLAAVAKGLEEVERTGSRFSLAHLYHVQGELILMRDPSNEAEAERHFRTAIDIARNQQARFWELRATTSLARLLKRQGKIDEARALLAGIYNWFTEGFEFADLKDAKALLDELAA